MTNELMDEKLWETARILAEEHKTEESIAVVSSIASHVLGRYSGKYVELSLKNPVKKELESEQFRSMKELSKNIAVLMEKGQEDEVREKALDYIDGIVSILASNPEEEKKLRRSFLKHFVRIKSDLQPEILYNHAPSLSGTAFEPFSSHLYLEAGTQDYDSPSKSHSKEGTYTTSEAAEILHVSDQTIRRMCDAGKFPEASRTDGGHWRIPKKHFRVTLNQSEQIDRDLSDIRKKSLEGGQVDEFDL